MSNIKLAPLPERTPVKLTISILPDLHATLQDYAAHYAQIYGREETISDLVPAMLAHFVESDRGFMRSRSKQGEKKS